MSDYKYPTNDEKDERDASGYSTARVSDPRVVIRGESISTTPTLCVESLANKISFIDYLAFTCRFEEPISAPFPLREELIEIFSIPRYSWQLTQTGWNGYKHRVNLDDLGLVAYGGVSQKNTVHVQLYGQGCSMVEDWIRVYLWGTSSNVKITRLDIAHDDFAGNTVNIAKALDWLEAGLFNLNGRPPKTLYIDDFDSGAGKTLYVGNRKNGKMARVYEKGKEQGQADSPWCRAESEFRSKDRLIPWDAVIHPDPYLAGSYEAFSFLSVSQSRLETINRAKAITLDRAVEFCKSGYGQLINLLYHKHGRDAEAVIRQLMREGVPKKLKPYYLKEMAELGITP